MIRIGKTTVSEELYQELAFEQNYTFALGAGILTSLLGALIWAFLKVSFISAYSNAFLAIFIAVMIGVVMRQIGRGLNPIYGFTGAFLTLFACFCGNMLGVIAFIAHKFRASYLEVVNGFEVSFLFDLMSEDLHLLNLVVYACALVIAYYLSFRPVRTPAISS